MDYKSQPTGEKIASSRPESSEFRGFFVSAAFGLQKCCKNIW